MPRDGGRGEPVDKQADLRSEVDEPILKIVARCGHNSPNAAMAADACLTEVARVGYASTRDSSRGGGSMARLIRLTLFLALAAALVVGGSWALAYNGVATLLGDPPPQMGIQTTTFLWDGLTQMEGAPRVWCFAFYPTLIPGAQSVRIYVTPTGRVIQTEPADLAVRVKELH